MNYTKGEWKSRQTESGDYEITSGDVNIACVYLTKIEPFQGTVKANAHLISAAPGMYADCWEALQCFLFLPDKYSYIVKRLQKTLAKAEGKSK